MFRCRCRFLQMFWLRPLCTCTNHPSVPLQDTPGILIRFLVSSSLVMPLAGFGFVAFCWPAWESIAVSGWVSVCLLAALCPGLRCFAKFAALDDAHPHTFQIILGNVFQVCQPLNTQFSQLMSKNIQLGLDQKDVQIVATMPCRWSHITTPIPGRARP